MVGDANRVYSIVPPGASPHTFDLLPSAARRLQTSVALFYGAEHLDEWVLNVSPERSYSLFDMLPDSLRRSLPGDVTPDPHFWTDPLAVKGLLPSIVDVLCTVDDSNCQDYGTNADRFGSLLASLHDTLLVIMAPVRDDAVHLSQPFFVYFLERYGPALDTVIEPSPGKSPAPAEMARLADRAPALRVRAILYQSQLPATASETVAEMAHLPLVELDPIGGRNGLKSYEAIILHNARATAEALTSLSPS